MDSARYQLAFAIRPKRMCTSRRGKARSQVSFLSETARADREKLATGLLCSLLNFLTCFA
jgi:hypothetical protein